MSAIAGVVGVDGHPVDVALPRAMMDATSRPVADGRSVWADGVAGLMRIGHATTPEARGEADLAPNAVTGCIIVFDGRLDHRDELLARLGEDGARLWKAPDPDVAMALFARFGDDFLTRLAGDFAFAIWQPQLRRLICARSATGWRPLFWTFDGKRFAFASEPAALVRGLGLDARVNEGFAGEILSARIVSLTETLWQGVHRVEPGCVVEVRDGALRHRRWFDERWEDLSHLSDADHVDRFNGLFDRALVACTRSDRGVAAHLSGGLDSSSIVARATRLHRAGAIAMPITAISARYPGEPHDESEWSGAVERDLGIAARIVGDLPFDLDRARAWCAESLHLPVRPNAMGPTLTAAATMQAAGERVLLTGEGGDDWMQGSRAHWPDLLLGGRWGTLLREGAGWSSEAAMATKMRWLASASIGPLVGGRQRAVLERPFLYAGVEPPVWLRREWADRIDLADRWRAGLADGRPASHAQMARRALIAPAQRDVVFGPIQSATAQFGVEQRHPFHDLDLIRFFMGAAGGMLRRDGVRKHLLREAMRGDLPETVRTRRSKAEFSAAIIDAIAGFLDRTPPSDMRIVRLGWADPAAIERLFEPHRRRRAGEAVDASAGALHGLWFCVAVELWLDSALRV